VARAVPRPRHRRDDHPMHAAGHPRRVSLQHRPDGAQIQGAPPTPTLAGVIARGPAPTDPAPAPNPAGRPHLSHQQVGLLVELDPLDDGLLDAQQSAP